MKTRDKILLATAAVAAVGLLVYAAKRHKKMKHVLNHISDEGYETASDVLYPGRNKRDTKIQYGPVLPV